MKIGDKEFKLEPDREKNCEGCWFKKDGDCTNEFHARDCWNGGDHMIYVEVKK